MVNKLISIRIPSDILKTLDNTATRHGTTKSALIRQLLANSEQFYEYLEWRKKQLVLTIQEKMPADFNSVMAETMGRMIHEVMVEVAKRMTEEKRGDKQNR